MTAREALTDAWQTTKQLAEKMGTSPYQAKKRLKRAMERGEARRRTGFDGQTEWRAA